MRYFRSFVLGVALAMMAVASRAAGAAAGDPVEENATVPPALQQALQEARRIGDPEVQARALSDVAGARMVVGDQNGAILLARSIRAEEWRGEALRKIAGILAVRDPIAAYNMIVGIADDDVRVAALFDLATVQLRSRDRSGARRTFEQACAAARDGVNSYLGVGLGRVMFLQAALGDAPLARQAVGNLVSPVDRVRALCDIAAGMEADGDQVGMDEALQRAQQEIPAIGRGGALSQALRSIGGAQVTAERIDEAIATAGRIEDPRLRAELWCEIGRSLRSGGATDAACAAYRNASLAAGQIVRGDSRVMALCRIAAERRDCGDSTEAEALIRSAREIAEGIAEADSRVRALCAIACGQSGGR